MAAKKKPKASTEGSFAYLCQWAEDREGHVEIEASWNPPVRCIGVFYKGEPPVSRYVQIGESFDDCAAIVLQALHKEAA